MRPLSISRDIGMTIHDELCRHWRPRDGISKGDVPEGSAVRLLIEFQRLQGARSHYQQA